MERIKGNRISLLKLASPLVPTFLFCFGLLLYHCNISDSASPDFFKHNTYKFELICLQVILLTFLCFRRIEQINGKQRIVNMKLEEKWLLLVTWGKTGALNNGVLLRSCIFLDSQSNAWLAARTQKMGISIALRTMVSGHLSFLPQSTKCQTVPTPGPH